MQCYQRNGVSRIYSGTGLYKNADQPRLTQTLPQSDAAVVVTALARPEQFHGDVSTNSACEVRSTEFRRGHATTC